MGKEKRRGEGEQLNTGGLDEACQQVQVSRCEAPPPRYGPRPEQINRDSFSVPSWTTAWEIS